MNWACSIVLIIVLMNLDCILGHPKKGEKETDKALDIENKSAKEGASKDTSLVKQQISDNNKPPDNPAPMKTILYRSSEIGPTAAEGQFKDVTGCSQAPVANVSASVEVSTRASATTESPIEVPFENQFEEVKNQSPLNYKPQKPCFAGSISNEVPISRIVPLENYFVTKENSSGAPLVNNNYLTGNLSTSTGSPIEIPFEDQYEEVKNQSIHNYSPLEYKPHRPSFAGSMSNGVPNQIVPHGNPLPSDPLRNNFPRNNTEENPLIHNNWSSAGIQSGSKSPLKEPKPAHKPPRPSFASSVSSGVPNQIIPPGKPLPGGSLENRFSENGNFSTATVPVTTKSPIEIPFEDQFEEVKPMVPNVPSLGYKPQRPSFAGSMPNGVPNQIEPLPSATLENRVSEVKNKVPSEAVVGYKPQRPSFAGSLSNGVPGQIIPPGKPLPDGPKISKLHDAKPSPDLDWSKTEGVSSDKSLASDANSFGSRWLSKNAKAQDFQDSLRAIYLKARGDIIEESRGPRRMLAPVEKQMPQEVPAKNTDGPSADNAKKNLIVKWRDVV